MVTRNGPLPKRRRIDTGPVSAEQVAQSNATLQHFMRPASRQSRWMHGVQASVNGGDCSANPVHAHVAEGAMQTDPSVCAHIHSSASFAQPPTGNNSIPAEAAHPEHPASVSATQAITETTSTPYLNSRHSTTAPPRVRSVALAGCESPGIAAPTVASSAETGAQDLMGITSLKSQAFAATGKQGLPSPAPSDEYSHSPRVDAEVHPAGQHRPPQVTGTPTLASAAVPSQARSGGSLTTRSSMPGLQRVHSTLNGAPANHPASPGSVGASSHPDPAPVSRASPSMHEHVNASSPLHIQRPSPLSAAPSLESPVRAAGNLAPPRAQVSNARAPSPAHAVSSQPLSVHPYITLRSFFDTGDLLQILDQLMQPYITNQSKSNDMAFKFEIGRLQLLREAIVKNDWFYVVLNQLSCLCFTSPDQLPQKMVREVQATAYQYVDALLCPNDILSKELITRFGMFPAPIMAIYSTPAVQAYQQLVDQAVEFLKVLPQSWGNIVHECKTREAPPLVQDMAEQLSLYSPVLQTTAFRALARSFWPATHMTEQGIDALVSLHHHDQATYARGERRTTEEKQRLYGAYTLVLNEFRKYEAFTRGIRSAPAQQRQPIPLFSLPPLALQAFGLPVLDYQPGSAPIMPRQTSQLQHIPAQQPEAQQAQGSMQYPQQPPQQLLPQQIGPMTHDAQRMNQRFLPQQSRTGTHYSHTNVTQPNARPRREARNTAPAKGGSHPVQQLHPQLQSQQTQFRQYQHAEYGNVRLQGAVFPPISSCPRSQPTEPDTTRVALHQAHLRSPILGPSEHVPGARKLYRHIAQFPLPPHALDPDQPVQVFRFKLNDTAKIPKSVSSAGTERKVRILTEHSTTFRLRCASLDPHRGFPDEGSWHVAENVWPETVYFILNDHVLEPRRKLHHGRYLPIDLTDLVCEGENELKVVVNRHSADRSTFSFAVAVELIRVMSHESIIKVVNRQTLPAEKSLEDIKKALAGPSSVSDDDDIVVTSSSMTIKLFDPITCAKIFTLPVRGQFCLHRDPFDLEVFLETRKRDKPGWPAVVDTWLCPICRGSVSPQHLIQDGFLVEVRKELEKKGLLGTRMITVAPDGSWKVKEEEEEEEEEEKGGKKNGFRSPSLERDEKAARVNSAAAQRREPVVIAID